LKLILYLIDAGYYLTFVTGARFSVAGRTLHRNLRPFILAPRSPLRPVFVLLYKPLGILMTSLTINTLVLPFMLWNMESSIKVWRSVLFFPLIWPLIIIVTFDFFGLGRVLGSLGRKWGYDEGKNRKDQ
jgi:lysophospholipid acyltransferase